MNRKKTDSNWSWIKLGDVCENIIGGGTPSTKNDEYWKGNIPWITSADIHGIKSINPRKSINQKAIDESATNLLPKGNIVVVTRVGLGKLAINDFDLCFSQDSQGLILKKDIISTEFLSIILSKAVQSFKATSRGTTISGVTKQQLKELIIPLPPLPEQHRIVEKIEELFSELDNGIENLKKSKEQIKTYRQAVLKSAFEGKLVQGKGQKANGKSENGELPEGWENVKVKDITEKIIGGGTPSTKNADFWDGEIDWITSADIYGPKEISPRKKITKEAIKNSATNLLPKGNIIVVTRVGLGKLAITDRDLCFSQDSQGLFINKNKVDVNYALWYLSSAVQIFRFHNRGTTIKGVTKKQLADLRFILPPRNHQTQIVEEIEKRFSVADKMEAAIDESLQKAEALRQSILKQAFEGKLV